jgi:AmmeMemoRadiSam system protein B
MGIPSAGDTRGQQDAVGFAATKEAMAKTWELSSLPPHPETFGAILQPGAAGIICPHDHYMYAGRIYRQVIPLLSAKTIVLVGVFHRYRNFGAKDVIVFDPYKAWRSPDGDIAIPPLRETIIDGLDKDDYAQSAAMHDSEHSLEALAYWLKHQREDIEIVPIMVPVGSEQRLAELAGKTAKTIAGAMKAKGLQLGKDVAIAISSDGTHYGKDFNHEPFGEGGVKAFSDALDRERQMLAGPLSGAVGPQKIGDFFKTCVDPSDPSIYRMTWCGRFSIPFGLMLLAQTAKEMDLPAPIGHPVALGFSVNAPELPLKPFGLGVTAPANLYHFVGYPAAAYTVGK